MKQTAKEKEDEKNLAIMKQYLTDCGIPPEDWDKLPFGDEEE